MAEWLQGIAHVMPLYYAADALSGIMYKGYVLGDIKYNLLVLLVFAIAFITLNIVSLKKYRSI